MEFKLINDHIPYLYRDEVKKLCKTAIITSESFYKDMLLQRLAEIANKLILTRHPMYLADLQIILDSYIKVVGGPEWFEPLLVDRRNDLGTFDERLIGFFEPGELEKVTEAFMTDSQKNGGLTIPVEHEENLDQPLENNQEVEEEAIEEPVVEEKPKKSVFKKKK